MEVQLRELFVWLNVWTMAANLRHVPEFLCLTYFFLTRRLRVAAGQVRAPSNVFSVLCPVLLLFRCVRESVCECVCVCLCV